MELWVIDLHVCRHPSIGEWDVIVLFLVHLFIQHILLGDAEGAAGTLLVDLGGTARRFKTSLETAVASTRGGNVRSWMT